MQSLIIVSTNSPSQTRFPARSSAMFIHFPPQADTVNTSSLMIFRVWTDLWNLCPALGRGLHHKHFPLLRVSPPEWSIQRPSQQTVTGYRLSGGTNMDWLLSIVSSSLLIAPIIPAFISIHWKIARLPFAGLMLLKALIVIYIAQFRNWSALRFSKNIFIKSYLFIQNSFAILLAIGLVWFWWNCLVKG